MRGPGRPHAPAAPRPAARAGRADPRRAVRAPGHGPAVGHPAPRRPRRRGPGHRGPPRAGAAALLDPAAISEIWGHGKVSDWQPGSRREHRRTDGSGTVDAGGRVLETDPPHRLVMTFGDATGDRTAGRRLGRHLPGRAARRDRPADGDPREPRRRSGAARGPAGLAGRPRRPRVAAGDRRGAARGAVGDAGAGPRRPSGVSGPGWRGAPAPRRASPGPRPTGGTRPPARAPRQRRAARAGPA